METLTDAVCKIVDGACYHCGALEGQHANVGGFCSDPDGWWLETSYQPKTGQCQVYSPETTWGAADGGEYRCKNTGTYRPTEDMIQCDWCVRGVWHQPQVSGWLED